MELRVRQVAEVLGVTPYRVRELIAAGRLKARHHPSAYYWLVSARSVQDYVQRGRLRGGRPRAVDTKTTTRAKAPA